MLATLIMLLEMYRSGSLKFLWGDSHPRFELFNARKIAIPRALGPVHDLP